MFTGGSGWNDRLRLSISSFSSLIDVDVCCGSIWVNDEAVCSSLLIVDCKLWIDFCRLAISWLIESFSVDCSCAGVGERNFSLIRCIAKTRTLANVKLFKIFRVVEGVWICLDDVSSIGRNWNASLISVSVNPKWNNRSIQRIYSKETFLL